MQTTGPVTTHLRWLVNQLMTSTQSVAVKNKSFFVNDVPAELYFSADAEWVPAVVSGLLRNMAAYARDSCIRISAKCCDGMILVQVRDNNLCNTISVVNSLQQMQGITQKMGGFLGVTSKKKEETVITFSFPAPALSA